jgi:excisionase family DNA binding protein
MIRRASLEQGQTQQPLHGAVEHQRKPVASEPFVPEPLLDTDQAAAIMRIHPKTLQRYARQGIVRGFQLGSMWRFRASDIDRWISEQLAS